MPSQVSLSALDSLALAAVIVSGAAIIGLTLYFRLTAAVSAPQVEPVKSGRPVQSSGPDATYTNDI